MKNKKVLIIGIIVAVVLVIAVVVGILVLKPFDKEDSDDDDDKKTSQTSEKKDKKKDDKKSDEKKSDHEKTIEAYADACDSKSSMRKFVKENVNLKALYAAGKMYEDIDYDEYMDSDVDEMEDTLTKLFEKAYKDAKKEDYEDEDFIDEVVDSFYDEDYKGIKITKVGKLTDGDGPKGTKTCEIEAELDGDKYTGDASFYDDKIVEVSLYQDYEYDYDDDDDDDDLESKLSKQEVEAFNAKFEAYEGSSKKGSDVKLLIDEVIASNKANEDKFVQITTYIDSFDNSDLNDANYDEDATAFAKAAAELKTEISSSKTYKVNVFTNWDGLIDDIWIEEN